jgi:hypothetical protein
MVVGLAAAYFAISALSELAWLDHGRVRRIFLASTNDVLLSLLPLVVAHKVTSQGRIPPG